MYIFFTSSLDDNMISESLEQPLKTEKPNRCAFGRLATVSTRFFPNALWSISVTFGRYTSLNGCIQRHSCQFFPVWAWRLMLSERTQKMSRVLQALRAIQDFPDLCQEMHNYLSM